MENKESENNLSNPLFDKELFSDPAGDNGIGGDNLIVIDELSFGGDGDLEPPFQEQLENFLESTGVEETIDPPIAGASGEESNASTIVSQTEQEEPMQVAEDTAKSVVVEQTTTNKENIKSEGADDSEVQNMEAVKEEETPKKKEETTGKEAEMEVAKPEVKEESKDVDMKDEGESAKQEVVDEKNKDNDKETEAKPGDKTEIKEEKSDEKEDKQEIKDEKPNDTMTKKERDAKIKSDKISQELEHHWKAVNKNPSDFTSWSYFLHFVETGGHLEPARKAFTEFFSRYPYCYGYWKKYADMEKKNGNLDKAKEVFVQGLKAIPLSVELWIHFINFTMQNTKEDEERVETIRKLFEQAIEAAGTDFKSDKLWDMYIKFEREQKDAKRLTHIYDRLIRIPTQLYSHHFEKFKKHLNSQPIKDVLSDAEHEKLRLEFLDDIEAELEASMKDDETDIPGGDVAPPGLDDAPPGVSDEPPDDQQKKSTIKEMKNEGDQIKEKALKSRNAIHKETEQEVSKRWTFEEAIKRPYFHVKPLEKPQLKNWIEYLDFEIAEGMLERVVILFERCLIACALYEDLWLKYAKFMEPHSIDGVRSVYTRACTIHLPNKLNIVSHWAAFEETQGNHEKAREILEDLEKRHPKSTLIILRQINFERRIGCHDNAIKIFKKALQKAENNKKEFVFFSSKLARYQHKILGDFDKAKEVLNSALKKDLDNAEIYLQLLDLEFQKFPPNEYNVMELFQMIQTSGLDASTKFMFSQRRMEFILDFGQDVKQLLQVFSENQKMLKLQQLAQKKRAASESTSENAAPPEKKAKTEAKASGDGATSSDVSLAQNQQQAQVQQSYQQPMHQNRPPPPQQMMPPYQQQGYNYGWNQYNQPPHNAYNYQQWGGYNQGYY
ncbi:pre-mRNA-processing factor 39-like [Antedon mediterranea]|uniref:pre-mRNA-processing factor 39-like n=1 Tax=Antedon mediterranea TaxID=105859 RepID=UPI003AF72BF8